MPGSETNGTYRGDDRHPRSGPCRSDSPRGLKRSSQHLRGPQASRTRPQSLVSYCCRGYLNLQDAKAADDLLDRMLALLWRITHPSPMLKANSDIRFRHRISLPKSFLKKYGRGTRKTNRPDSLFRTGPATATSGRTGLRPGRKLRLTPKMLLLM
jgi:hypothetical protein